MKPAPTISALAKSVGNPGSAYRQRCTDGDGRRAVQHRPADADAIREASRRDGEQHRQERVERHQHADDQGCRTVVQRRERDGHPAPREHRMVGDAEDDDLRERPAGVRPQRRIAAAAGRLGVGQDATPAPKLTARPPSPRAPCDGITVGLMRRFARVASPLATRPVRPPRLPRHAYAERSASERALECSHPLAFGVGPLLADRALPLLAAHGANLSMVQ